MRIDKVLVMALFFMYSSAYIFAKDNNKEKISVLLEQCASMEYKLLSLQGKEKVKWVEECNTNYLKVFDVIEKLTQDEIDQNKVFYSRVFDRTGWFLCMNTPDVYKQYQNIQKYDNLLSKSVKLDPTNFIAYYKLAMKSKFHGLGGYIYNLKKAFEINPNSPEVNFELGFCLYNTSREPELVQKHQKLFFDNKKNFLPELHYFDTGYPNLKLLKYIPENETETKMLERIEVYKPEDKTRFQLK